MILIVQKSLYVLFDIICRFRSMIWSKDWHNLASFFFYKLTNNNDSAADWGFSFISSTVSCSLQRARSNNTCPKCILIMYKLQLTGCHGKLWWNWYYMTFITIPNYCPGKRSHLWTKEERSKRRSSKTREIIGIAFHCWWRQKTECFF